MRDIAQAYLELCDKAREFKREFFGLRDYYSLIKMIYYFCTKDSQFTWNKIVHSVMRNFNGLEIDPVEIFHKYLHDKISNNINSESDPKCDPIDLIKSGLKGEFVELNSRYLLFIAENSNSIDIIQNYMINTVGIEPQNLSVIFGSSFRADQEYTEICRNISLIKHSMEVGKTVILLNSYNLYESLYDALNQYYYELAGQKYVDLGLGTHRTKCSVNENFKLIIIAEKAAVYDSKRFPIPLLNRLEKHFLNSSIMLNKQQIGLVESVNIWTRNFCVQNIDNNEAFIGFNYDTIANLVLHYSTKTENKVEILRLVKNHLLKCATPDSVIRASSISSKKLDQKEQEFIWNEYFNIQKHLYLKELLTYHLQNEKESLVQVTTHSKSSIINLDCDKLIKDLNLNSIDICLLNSFDTQQQFLNKFKHFFSFSSPDKKNMLLIEADIDEKYSLDLISCVRYQLIEMIKTIDNHQDYLVCLVIRINKETVKNFIGYQVGYWQCYHMDELMEHENDLPEFKDLQNKTLSTILSEAYEKQLQDEYPELGLDLSYFYKKIAHKACSLLIDTNLTRTISRIDLFISLCNYDSFVLTLTNRLIDIQYEKEKEHLTSLRPENWLFEHAANLKEINQYSTLRKSCQNYFESRLSPLLAYLLSFIDSYLNMDILYEAFYDETNSLQWKRDLWLRLFNNRDFCRLSYADMRMESKGKETGEMKRFVCNSEFLRKSLREQQDKTKTLRAHLPFFWLLIEQLNSLYRNFIESNNANMALTKTGKIFNLNTYSIVVSKFFEENNLYKLMNEIVVNSTSKNTSDFVSMLITSYIHDFVLINCHVNNSNDLALIEHLICSMFESNSFKIDMKYKQNLQYSLPIIHYLFDQIEFKIDLYLKFSSFDSDIFKTETFKKIFMNSKFTEDNFEELSIHLDACLECIALFKQKFTYSRLNNDRIFQLLQLISNLILRTKKETITNDEEMSDTSNYSKQRVISQNFESLNMLKLFLNLLLKFDNSLGEHDQEIMKLKMYSNVLNQLNLTYFYKDVDFKTKHTIQNLHEFLIYAQNSFHEFLIRAFGNNEQKRIELHGSLNDYLNTLYVDVVESLCFSDETRPSDEAIELLLKSLTDKKIIALTPNSHCLEIQQMHRYLLVQLLFKNYNEIVVKNLNKWFNSTDIIGHNKMFTTHEEMAILFQNCVFDQYVNQVLNDSLDDQIFKANQICCELLAEKDSLRRIFEERKIILKSFNVNFLIKMAKLRFTVSVLVKASNSQESLDSIKSSRQIFNDFNNKMNELISFIKQKSDTAINFLIKEIIRKYGSQSVKFVMYNENLNWMTPKEIIGDDQNITDVYVLMGDKYLECKDAINQCIQVKNVDLIRQMLDKGKGAEQYLPYLACAFYQNITLLYKSLRESASQMSEIFKSLLEPYFKLDIEHLINLCDNQYTNCMKVDDENWKNIDFSVLLVLLKYAILYSKYNMIKPLRKMILEPASVREQFVPCMPQDQLYEIKSAVSAGSHGESTKFYCKKRFLF